MEMLTDDLLGKLITFCDMQHTMTMFHSNKVLQNRIVKLIKEVKSVREELVCNSLDVDVDFLDEEQLCWIEVLLLSLENRNECLIQTVIQQNYFGFIESFTKLPISSKVLQGLVEIKSDNCKFQLLNLLQISNRHISNYNFSLERLY